jgi:hypothetical protein
MTKRRWVLTGLLFGLVAMAGGCVEGWGEGLNDGVAGGISTVVESLIVGVFESVLP